MAEVLIHGSLSTAFRSIDMRKLHRGWDPETFENGRIGAMTGSMASVASETPRGVSWHTSREGPLQRKWGIR